MSDESRSSGLLSTLSDSGKWAILAGIPLLAAAAYFFFTPISLTQATGGYFYCGSASSPNTDSAQVCEPVEKANRNKALAAFGAGIAVPLVGVALFSPRRASRRLDEAEEHHGPREVRRGRDLLGDDERAARRPKPKGDGRPTGDDLDDLDDFEQQSSSRRRGGDDWADGDRL